MRPTIFKLNAKTKDRVARWVSFLALVALFAMSTLPITSGHRDIAATGATHWSNTWHG